MALLTASEARVLGTAISISEDDSVDAIAGGQHANVQKFMVLTSSRCNNHGCDLSSGDASSGSTVLMDASS